MFLKEIDCKILIKYDGERSLNVYTIKLLYNSLGKGSLGKDTDSPISAIAEIAEKENEIPLNEVEEEFAAISDSFINSAITKYGKRCVVSVKIE